YKTDRIPRGSFPGYPRSGRAVAQPGTGCFAIGFRWCCAAAGESSLTYWEKKEKTDKKRGQRKFLTGITGLGRRQPGALQKGRPAEESN
ncbi:hypothetical protein, partial [Sphingobacterium phlebotomi]|uniref:hypothetical protein n=1 Tax=Sphingobacterium phlebotomi TaxID=2605433 RepID=UPI001653667F